MTALVVDAKTSARMGRVRQSGTAPEIAVRAIMTALGRKYRIGPKLPGRPDLANRTERVAEIASLGGVAAHVEGTAHEFTVDEAREAGRKGGLATAKRKGGTNGVQTQR